jgi:hypothetical protein
MSATRIGILLVSAISIGGCGFLVPDINEFWGTPLDARIKVNKISAQVVCELRRAVQKVYQDNREQVVEIVADPRHPPHPYDLSWFDNWGVQVTLTLTYLESTTAAPTISFITPLTTPMTSYATNVGATLSTAATRTDILNMFYNVSELKHGIPSIDKSCLPSPANADLFVQSDLKLYDWLSAALLPSATGIINYNAQVDDATKNVISHDVKFEIVTNASVTPTWTLVRLTANTTGSLFAADRDRTQDLNITFGPKAGSQQLAAPAANTHLATQIGLAVSQSLRAR